MQTEIIIVPFIFGTLGFIVWVLVNGWQRRQQVKALTDFNTRLLERIGSVKEFSEFLQTAGGAAFIERVAVSGTPPDIRLTIVRAVQTGLVLVALGLGLIFLSWNFKGQFPEARTFTISGVIALSLGVGFLLSGGASHRLAAGMRRNDG